MTNKAMLCMKFPLHITYAGVVNSSSSRMRKSESSHQPAGASQYNDNMHWCQAWCIVSLHMHFVFEPHKRPQR